jgi:hypothetical protein
MASKDPLFGEDLLQVASCVAVAAVPQGGEGQPTRLVWPKTEKSGQSVAHDFRYGSASSPSFPLQNSGNFVW